MLNYGIIRLKEKNKDINISKNYWNSFWEQRSNTNIDEIIYDNWLDMFLDTIVLCESPIIDLGCGEGNNTKYLIEKGKDVIACDYSSSALKTIEKVFLKNIKTMCFDMLDGIPFKDNFTDLIIADLSLHYFSKNETIKILQEIKRVLNDNVMLLFRVNSINDVNHGAGCGKEIEENFYEMPDGQYKRFFSCEDVVDFFKYWQKIIINEEEMLRYQKPKILLKCAFKK